MIKRALKYLIIVFVNLVLLTILLLLWTDKFETEFNSSIRLFEFLKLIGISILGLIILSIVISSFKKLKTNSVAKKIRVSIILILLISSYFYIDYGKKIYKNRFLNYQLRQGVVEKIEPIEDGLAYGNQAKNLTAIEYAEITKIKWFPKIPSNAENIDYSYDYDGFLPDYSFSLSYDLPKTAKVDTMRYENDTFSKSRVFKIVGNKKRVTYSEFLW